MADVKRKREDHMATSKLKHKPAIETLLESMNELADSAAKRMTAEELRQTRKEIDESIDRVVSGGRQRRRETA
jgi:hypothetical protein